MVDTGNQVVVHVDKRSEVVEPRQWEAVVVDLAV